ncbi:MAG: type II toxin-antitoxin system VapC family toxin [Saprospiraceae bacterium]|nr:type II toxin-antitoxin system VapC family toxin [Saprospiraceae bacterium]
MGTQYLIDTNAVIEFLGGTLPATSSHWIENIIGENIHHLSVINQIELLGFNGSPAEMQTLEEFIEVTNILPLTDAVVQKTIQLRRSQKINLPDAIIAATALSNNLTLITRNLKDFQYLKELICLDSHKL